jgi:hypothetical protein
LWIIRPHPSQKQRLRTRPSPIPIWGQFAHSVSVQRFSPASKVNEKIERFLELSTFVARIDDVIGLLGDMHGALGGELQELNSNVRQVGEARIADILHLGKPGTPSLRERTIARLIREALIGSVTNLLSSNSKENVDLQEGCK